MPYWILCDKHTQRLQSPREKLLKYLTFLSPSVGRYQCYEKKEGFQGYSEFLVAHGHLIKCSLIIWYVEALAVEGIILPASDFFKGGENLLILSLFFDTKFSNP